MTLFLDLQVCVARMKDIFIIGNKGSCHVILSLSLLQLSELSYGQRVDDLKRSYNTSCI